MLKTVSTANGLVSPTFSGNVTLSDGNLIIGTSGKGIDFSATPGTGTSELLADYEEGTWTATLFDAGTGGNASPTTVTGYYTKVGDLVTASFSGLNNIDTTGMTGAVFLYISLPFTANATTGGAGGSIVTDTITWTVGRTSITPVVFAGSSRAIVYICGSAVSIGGILVSDVTSGVADIVRFTLTYKV